MADDNNKKTKIFFTDGTALEIPKELDHYNVTESVLILSFKRGYRGNAKYFIPIDRIRCVVYDDNEIIDEIHITNPYSEQEVIRRLAEDE